jgi:hypothetical protein
MISSSDNVFAIAEHRGWTKMISSSADALFSEDDAWGIAWMMRDMASMTEDMANMADELEFIEEARMHAPADSLGTAKTAMKRGGVVMAAWEAVKKAKAAVQAVIDEAAESRAADSSAGPGVKTALTQPESIAADSSLGPLPLIVLHR